MKTQLPWITKQAPSCTGRRPITSLSKALVVQVEQHFHPWTSEPLSLHAPRYKRKSCACAQGNAAVRFLPQKATQKTEKNTLVPQLREDGKGDSVIYNLMLTEWHHLEAVTGQDKGDGYNTSSHQNRPTCILVKLSCFHPLLS